MFPMSMSGHDRTYLPPRSLRPHVGGPVTAWDLFKLEQQEPTKEWASTTLTALLSAAEAEAADVLGCTECHDTGFYGVADPENPDLLTGLIRREGDDNHQALQTSGVWQDWDPLGVPLEVLDLDLAGDLAAAITGGACGLLRRYCMPKAWLPPAPVVASTTVADVLSAFISPSPQENPEAEWVNFAVVDEVDQGAVLDLVRIQASAAGDVAELWDGRSWTPDSEVLVKADLPLVQLNGVQLSDVQEQMNPAITAGVKPTDPQKCHYCKDPATKSLLHSEGMGYIPACADHLEKATYDAEHCTPDGTEDKSNLISIRDITAALQPIVADAPLTVSPDPRAEKLRRYWTSGKGGAKIRWTAPGSGDWYRCVKHLSKYMGTRAKGYCFTGDAEFVTRDGVMTFAEAAGTTQFVLTQANPVGRRSTPVRADGYWVEAPIMSFGEQRVLRVTLSRGGIQKVVKATPEHRWMASPNGRNVRRFDVEQVATADLRPGMALTMLSAAPPDTGRSMPPDAICAGAVFGDGSRTGTTRSRIDLYQHKRELARFFEPYASSISVGKTMTSTSELADRVYGLPGNWKDSPDLNQPANWLRGWLAGLLATDGSVGTNGAVSISSADPTHLRTVQDICHRLGIVTSGFGSSPRLGYGAVETPLYRLLLSSPSLSPDLFVRADQRSRFRPATKSSGRWTVVSVEDHGEAEEVFCATVPETESFALADNIWTLNCSNLHKRATGVWPGDKRNRGLLSSAPEEALLASVRSRRWTGGTERNLTMTDLQLVDGTYAETDDRNTGIFSTVLAGGFPVDPPDEWFDDPKLNEVTPIQVTDDGRVFGHIAPWGVTHIGMAGSVPAPRNRTGKYTYFRTGYVVTASGKKVDVGQLTLVGGHAPIGADAPSAVKHYDDTNSAVADISVGEDRHGIWAAGALRPNVTPEQIRAMRACPPSGDWRPINGNLELVAACHVNVQGFPIAKARVASGAIVALVAAGARQMAELMLARQADPVMMSKLEALTAQVAELVASAAVAEAPAEPATETPAEALPPEAANPAAAATTGVEEPDVPEPSTEELARAQKIAHVRAELAAVKRQQLRDRVSSGAPEDVTAALPPQFLAHKKKTGGDGEKEKSTIKGTDSFPIANKKEDGGIADLKKAIQAFGRAGDKPAAKKHIIAMAYKLKRPDLIPDGWSKK